MRRPASLILATLMVAHSEVLNHNGGPEKFWRGMILLSMLCHILLFSAVLFLPELGSRSPSFPSAVTVDLVSLPAGGPPSAGVGHAPGVSKPAPPPKPKEEAVPAKKETPAPPKAPKTAKPEVQAKKQEVVSTAPETPAVKRSLKKQTYDPSKVIDQAISKIEKEAAESRPSPVQKAIDALREKVQTEGEEPAAAGSGSGSGSTPGGAMGRGPSGPIDQLAVYRAEIWHRVRSNWAFSEEMAGGRTDLEAVVICKIMRNGQIRDIWFEQRSGNAYYDDSVEKALKKSDPLPPLPGGFIGSYYDVGFRFKPEDLQRRP